VNVALNRPSRASSESPDHPARHANDGDAGTYWSASSGDSSPYWQVDLEGFYQLASLKLVFPTPVNHRFVVATSLDGAAWRESVDRRGTTRSDAVRNDVFPPGTMARFVRITLDSPSPSLAEVELQGVIANR
jgi:hypothetical protein